MRLALYQPDIPQNLGAFIRLAACAGTPLDIIEPCGFPVDDRRIRRASMDYVDLAQIRRHASWDVFRRDRAPGRLVLLTTASGTRLPEVRFRADDTLLLGRESAGVPAEVIARPPASCASRSSARSNWSICAVAWIRPYRSSPMARSGGSKSGLRSRPIRACSCSMSRSPA